MGISPQIIMRTPPMSNLERQRLFRERNPGYYGRLHRKRKAHIQAVGAQQAAIAAMMKVKTQLMLPGPAVVVPGVLAVGHPITLPLQQREAIPLERAA